MPTSSPDDARLLPRLLHDASLAGVDLDRARRRLATTWSGCLRADPEGGELLDEPVELALVDVSHVRLLLDAADPFARPSTLPAPIPPGPGALEASGSHDDWLVLDDPRERRWVEEALFAFDLFVESTGEVPEAPRSVVFPVRAVGVPPDYQVLAQVGCGRIEASAAGVPLALEAWTRQLDAWWSRWEDHWERWDDDDDQSGVVQVFEGAIPVRRSPGSAARFLPEEPVFALAESDAPAEILAPLEAYFTAWHGRDWVALARLEGAETQAEIADRVVGVQQLCEASAGYARAVDRFWVEGDRACVVLRGVDYHAPDPADDLEEEALESVWTFGLRRRGGRWVVASQSQGWPVYGSAEKLPRGEKSWLDDWRAIEVRTGEP